MIEHVTDTALWVAVYRALESERPDALFDDPFARRLAGERGFQIERHMKGTQHTRWSLTMRTVIIDDFILKQIAQGVDTVVNLGAGLDSRPYRLKLPPNLRWIEVDFPAMVTHKEKILTDEKPNCQLERVALDLTQRELRKQLFARIGGHKVLILTEGVIPYLSEQNVAELADDLRAHKNFAFWIVDYFAPEVMKFIKRRRKTQMKNAPFLFMPADWKGFFAQHGWRPRETRYLSEESKRLGRPIPQTWLSRLMRIFFGAKVEAKSAHFLAYVLLEPNVD
jgi:methyltransferase (TIGR00027 family)